MTIWDNLAGFWDNSVVDGDPFHRTFIYPNLVPLADPIPGRRILEVGCGNGALSRRLAARGATVLGVDFSRNLLACARERTERDAVTYEYADACDVQLFTRRLEPSASQHPARENHETSRSQSRRAHELATRQCRCTRLAGFHKLKTRLPYFNSLIWMLRNATVP